VPWFRFYRTERLVTCHYFYIHDFHQGLLLRTVLGQSLVRIWG